MNVPSELLEAVVASLILAIGLIAIAFAAARRPSGGRTPLWFGLFACLYGVRLAGESQLVQPAFPEVFWRYLDAFVTYAILVPIGLFIESVFGPGWRLILRRTWQAAAVYASLAIVNDVMRQQPGATLWLNPPAVLTAVGIMTAHVLTGWRRERWPREFRAVGVGGLGFVGVAVYRTLGGELQLLEPLAMLVFMSLVGYFVAQRMLASERQLVAVSRELDLARGIQESILPRALPDIAGLRVAACYVPMNAVGGDFYDFNTERANCLGIIVADVSGHGVPAALVASMVKIAFAAEADLLDRPGLALAHINRTLCGRFAGAYVTACCGFIDMPNRTLRYASAGHPAPLLRRRDGRVESLDQRGLLLAFDANTQYATAEVSLNAGDRLVLFSDGLLEACNVDDEFFGETRLEGILVASRTASPQLFVDEIVGDVRRWVGSDTHLGDDLTVVVVDVAEYEQLDELGAGQ